MPVTTRTLPQSVIHFIAPSSVNKSEPESVIKYCFITNMKKLFAWCNSAQGKENQIRMCFVTYRYINEELPDIICKTSVNLWIKFAAVTYLRAIDFIRDIEQGKWQDIDSELVENFTNEFTKTINFVESLIKNNWDISSHESVLRVKQHICKSKNLRPRRNIKRVNYAGMA